MLMFAGGGGDRAPASRSACSPRCTARVPISPARSRTRPASPAARKAARRFRTTLATVQIAMSMALLVPAGLFAKSLFNVSRVDLGLKADHMMLFSIAPELNWYTTERTRQLFERIEDEIAAVPGVTSVVAAIVPVLAGDNWGNSLVVEGFEAGPGHQHQRVVQRRRPRLLQDDGHPADDGPRVHARRCVRRAEGRDRQPGVREEVQPRRQPARQALRRRRRHRTRSWTSRSSASRRTPSTATSSDALAAAVLPAVPAGRAARLRATSTSARRRRRNRCWRRSPR